MSNFPWGLNGILRSLRGIPRSLHGVFVCFLPTGHENSMHYFAWNPTESLLQISHVYFFVAYETGTAVLQNRP